MDNRDFCRQFHTVISVPIACAEQKENTLHCYPEGLPVYREIINTLDAMFHPVKNPDYYITSSFCYFGVVTSGNTTFFIGPVSSTPVSDAMIRDFMHEFSIQKQDREQAVSLLSQSPCISFHQFLNILSFVHLWMNQETLDIVEHFNLVRAAKQQGISEKHFRSLYELKEEKNFHNSYHFEQECLNYVENGETEKIKALLADAATIPPEGIVADNALRQVKNIFIATTTLVTRAAVSGGLDGEQAYTLSDNYIQEMEKLRRIDEVNALQYTMMIDFSERVSHQKVPIGMSREIFACIQYISQHTNEPLQVDDVAAYVNMSRSTITRKFKKELGFDIGSFIRRCKLEEARSLLRFTNKSLSEISAYLCFSSQSHFQTAFKAKYGITPLQYRNKSSF